MKLRYVGHAEGWDDLLVYGSLDDMRFLAFYGQHGQVMAVAGWVAIKTLPQFLSWCVFGRCQGLTICKMTATGLSICRHRLFDAYGLGGSLVL